MKMTFIIGTLSFGGAERVISNLANYFAKCNQEVLIITFYKREISYDLYDSITLINGINGKNKFKKVIALRKLISKEKPDVIISFLTQINIAVLLSLSGKSIPIIVSERSAPKQAKLSIPMQLMRSALYCTASGIVFQTADAQKCFSRKIYKNSIVIPNPVYITDEALPEEKRLNQVIVAGRLIKSKRTDLIIKAFHEASLHMPQYSMHIYGDGEERKNLEQLTSRLGLEEKVFFHGTIKNLHSNIRYGKIFVMASEYEGMPNALMEAMGLGLACICTDCPCGGPRMLIKNNVNGCLIPVNDEQTLLETLQYLMQEESFREKLSINAKEICQEMSIDKIGGIWAAYIMSNILKEEGFKSENTK